MTTAEMRLLEALQPTPGLPIAELARVVGCCKTITGDRLRQLARDGMVEKDAAGHWRWREELEVDAEP
jgi:DNA-binding IclR family transcriptional regulator